MQKYKILTNVNSTR